MRQLLTALLIPLGAALLWWAVTASWWVALFTLSSGASRVLAGRGKAPRYMWLSVVSLLFGAAFALVHKWLGPSLGL